MRNPETQYQIVLERIWIKHHNNMEWKHFIKSGWETYYRLLYFTHGCTSQSKIKKWQLINEG
jgi:hypothetical protein